MSDQPLMRPALLVRLVEGMLECIVTSVESIPLLSATEAVAVVSAGYVCWIAPADEGVFRKELLHAAASGNSVSPVRMSGYRSRRDVQRLRPAASRCTNQGR